jgi:uncharacterized protein
MADNSRDIEKASTQRLEYETRPPIQLTPEQYERLFLQPGGVLPASTGSLSRRLGNPTPLGIMAYLLCLTPTACFLMGWGGSDATSLVTMVGAYYFIGGLALVTAGVMEWVCFTFFSSTHEGFLRRLAMTHLTTSSHRFWEIPSLLSSSFYSVDFGW